MIKFSEYLTQAIEAVDKSLAQGAKWDARTFCRRGYICLCGGIMYQESDGEDVSFHDHPDHERLNTLSGFLLDPTSGEDINDYYGRDVAFTRGAFTKNDWPTCRQELIATVINLIERDL